VPAGQNRLLEIEIEPRIHATAGRARDLVEYRPLLRIA
jgi:hypothetical protein